MRGSSQDANFLFLIPFGVQSMCSDAECVGGLRQDRFRLNAASATPSTCFHSVSTNVPRSLWSVTLYFFFVLVAKIRKHGSSRTDCAQSHTAHDVGKNLDHAGAVMIDSTPLRCGDGERCCARSEGEHHLDHPKSFRATRWETPAPLHLQTPCWQRF